MQNDDDDTFLKGANLCLIRGGCCRIVNRVQCMYETFPVK